MCHALNQYTSVAGVTQSYDTRGNLLGPTGTTTYTYDAENRLRTGNTAGTFGQSL